MDFIERVMRVMTHVNIGAALGLVAWLLWSGWQVVTGQIAPAQRMAEARAVIRMAHAAPPLPMRLVPLRDAGTAPPPCHESPPATALAGADL